MDAVLEDFAVLAASASEDSSRLLDVIARIDQWCYQLAALRISLLRDAEHAGEPGLSVAERLHATNQVSRPASRGT